MFGYRKLTCYLFVLLLFLLLEKSKANGILVDSLKISVQATEDQEEKALLYKKIADQFYEVHQDTTTKYYHKALEQAKASPSYLDDITILRSFAHLYGNRQNKYQKAQKYLREAYVIAHSNNDNKKLAVVKNDLGIMAQKSGNFEEAIKCFFDAYHLIQKDHDDNVAMRILLSLGVIHNETAYNAKAVDYYKAALPLAKKVGHYRIFGLLHNNLGKAYRDLQNFSASKQHLDAAFSTFDSLNNIYWKGLVHYNYGYNEFLQKNYEEAITQYNAALTLNQISKEIERDVMLHTSLAEVYGTLGQHDKAIEHALLGLSILKQITTTEYYAQLHKILGKCFQVAGDFEKSSHHLEQHIHYKAQRKEEDNTSKIGQLQAMHEATLKSEAIKKLELKTEAEQANKEKTQLFFRVLLLSFVLVLALIGVFSYRQKLMQSEKNYQLRNQLARDLHDNIGSSLNHIKILLNRFRRKATIDPGEIKSIQNISDDVIVNMYDLIWSLDKEKEKVNDLLEYMRDHASNVFSPLNVPIRIKVKKPRTNKAISPEIKNNVYSIYKEAINNIVKHTQPREVTIDIQVIQNTLLLSVSNDISILKEQDSSGIGLNSMRKRARLIKGQLNIGHQNKRFSVELKVPLFT